MWCANNYKTIKKLRYALNKKSALVILLLV